MQNHVRLAKVVFQCTYMFYVQLCVIIFFNTKRVRILYTDYFFIKLLLHNTQFLRFRSHSDHIIAKQYNILYFVLSVIFYFHWVNISPASDGLCMILIKLWFRIKRVGRMKHKRDFFLL